MYWQVTSKKENLNYMDMVRIYYSDTLENIVKNKQLKK